MGGGGLPARVRPPGRRPGRARRPGGPGRARADRGLAAVGADTREVDPIDATAIARAALREGIDTLPVAFLDEQAHEVRLLADYRDQLINERVRLVNRLRLASGADRPRARGANQARQADRPADPREGHPRDRQATQNPAGQDRETDPQAHLRHLPRRDRTARRAQNTDPDALPSAAGRARLRTSHSSDHHRSHRRRQTLPRPTRASPATLSPPRSRPAPATPNATGCTAAATVSSTARFTSSRSPKPAPTRPPAPTSTADTPKAKPKRKRSAA